MADLGAERDPEFDTFGEQGVVAAVGRRRSPQPRQQPQPDKTVVAYSVAQFPNRDHRPVQVDGGQAGESGRMLADPFGDLVVGDQVLAVGSAPCRQQADVDPGVVHRGDGGVDRQFLFGDLPASPALQRREEVGGE